MNLLHFTILPVQLSTSTVLCKSLGQPSLFFISHKMPAKLFLSHLGLKVLSSSLWLLFHPFLAKYLTTELGIIQVQEKWYIQG